MCLANKKYVDTNTYYICPVCGFLNIGTSIPEYDYFSIYDNDGDDDCDCCGYQGGGTIEQLCLAHKNGTIENYRKEWLARGGKCGQRPIWDYYPDGTSVFNGRYTEGEDIDYRKQLENINFIDWKHKNFRMP